MAELLLLLLVVPSPLQVSCRVESCPGMVMDLAVEGGLESGVKKITNWQAGTRNHPTGTGNSHSIERVPLPAPTLHGGEKLAALCDQQGRVMLEGFFLHRTLSGLPYLILHLNCITRKK